MFICPVCRQKLNTAQGRYYCENGHSFDISNKGYVNLLISNRSSKRHHGDDKIMAISRRQFLNKGYYKPLLDAICERIGDSSYILDAGCGECYYTEGVCSFCNAYGKNAKVYGIDISKEIISVAAPRIRHSDIKIAVAGCNDMPFENDGFDAVLSVFAPVFAKEFNRVLSENGILIRVTPGKNHLIELKRAVYKSPKYNNEIDLELKGFTIDSQKVLQYEFKLENNNDIKNLFTMTPYYHTTSRENLDRLESIKSLEITSEFVITVYKKQINRT